MQNQNVPYNDYYAPTAYDSSHPRRRPAADTGKFGYLARTFRRNPLANHGSAQCGEFFSRFREVGIIQQLNSGKPDVLKILESPAHEVQHWQTLRNPRAVINVITKLMLIFSVIAWACIALVLAIAVFKRPDYYSNMEFILTVVITPSVPTLLFFVGKYFNKSSWLKDKNNILFNRRRGMVSIPRKKAEPLELRFDEFDGYLGSTVNPGGTTDYHLILAHRYSAAFVQHPGGSLEPWNICVEWELVQQYMDISKPLPDIPSSEPFRLKDPVTAEYDQKHNRPPRYWRDMDDETALRMQKASAAAAAQYPCEQALASGWQPSGFGQGDWRNDSQEHQQAVPAGGA